MIRLNLLYVQTVKPCSIHLLCQILLQIIMRTISIIAVLKAERLSLVTYVLWTLLINCNNTSHPGQLSLATPPW